MPGIQIAPVSYGASEIVSGYIPGTVGTSPDFVISDVGTHIILFIGAFLLFLFAGATTDVQANLQLASGPNITGNQDIARVVPGTGTGPPFTSYGVVPLYLGAPVGFFPAPGVVSGVTINLLSSTQPFQCNGGSGIWVLARQAD